MWKRRILFIVSVVFLILAACSNTDDSSMNSDDASDDNSQVNEMETETYQDAEQTGNESGDNSAGETAENNARATTDSEPQTDRMVIYTADMMITIGDFDAAQDDVQSLVEETDGYIVNSHTSSGEDNVREGQLTVRIPQEKFIGFLDDVEDIADEVKERNVNGEDITKEYVDLESRLKAKEEVKKRLENLLDEAEDTEDLLDISNRLGETQEDIEEVKGQMQYLEDHSAMSTVDITMMEESVEVGGVKKKGDLNTWEKTKKALVNSTNALVTFFSGIVIFLVGYSPILIPIIIIAFVIHWIYRRQQTKQK